MASIMRADLADAVPFRVDYVDDGVQLQTFALRDVGVDALFDLPEPQTVYRVKLGDMCFVARKRHDGSISHLYFVPEYPNNDLGLKERLTTYYALRVMGSAPELCELRACDPSLRIVDWDAGVAMIARLKGTATCNTRTITRILEVDALLKRHRPNLSHAEMRETVGPASGARLTVSSFLVGDVT
jgi:hypothetical protein